MEKFQTSDIPKSARITRLAEHLYERMPVIESARAKLLTESYKETESEPMITRRAKAFAHILRNIPIIIRDGELVVGSTTLAPRGCQTYPEFSYQWLEDELDTVETRSAAPFYIAEETKAELREVHKYWKGRTVSELAVSYMAPEAVRAMKHNIFTPGSYFYGGAGHITVKYDEVLAVGYEGIMEKAQEELDHCRVGDGDYAEKSHFLNAVILSCQAAIEYAQRYSALAAEMAYRCRDDVRRSELLMIAANCGRVPAKGARNFYEACQSFWFVQQLIQLESGGHSVSPGRFDQYMYPYYKKDMERGNITREFAQELMDCIWVKLNDLNKCYDAASAKGFAGVSLFRNVTAGGQNKDGEDVTNDLSFMCIQACMHVRLPEPLLCVRVWNGSPCEFLIKAAELTGTGTGVPAYCNDEVIIPALQNRGLSLADAREYNIIGCGEPQRAGKTQGRHDAGFFNMCRPLEIVFADGMDKGEMTGISTGDAAEMDTFEEFYDAYKRQMEYFISLLVNAGNAIDVAHAKRCPLPFLSCMVDDCLKRGKSVQEGGAVYNFTGPQGYGIANVADALFAVHRLVYEEQTVTMDEMRDALAWNFGRGPDAQSVREIAEAALEQMAAKGREINEETVLAVLEAVRNTQPSEAQMKRYEEIRNLIEEVPKFGNDIPEVDYFARDVAYTYTRPLQNYTNPRGGRYQAGLGSASAGVSLGEKTGATPDGRYAHAPVTGGVSPSAGRDRNGPAAAVASAARLDHFIASNGTLFNWKFHPSALAGGEEPEKLVSLIREYFDRKGMHMQFYRSDRQEF